MDARKISMARTLMEDPNASISDVCDALRVSRATLYRHLEKDAGK
jgi:AcrR family transcriptional regulator